MVPRNSTAVSALIFLGLPWFFLLGTRTIFLQKYKLGLTIRMYTSTRKRLYS